MWTLCVVRILVWVTKYKEYLLGRISCLECKVQKVPGMEYKVQKVPGMEDQFGVQSCTCEQCPGCVSAIHSEKKKKLICLVCSSFSSNLLFFWRTCKKVFLSAHNNFIFFLTIFPYLIQCIIFHPKHSCACLSVPIVTRIIMCMCR